MSENIKDERGRIIARITDEGSEVRLRDAQGRTLGHYSRTRDETRDALHRPVGPGDQLMRLIPRR